MADCDFLEIRFSTLKSKNRHLFELDRQTAFGSNTIYILIYKLEVIINKVGTVNAKFQFLIHLHI